MTKIEEANTKGNSTIKAKQLKLVCYMFELFYHLMIGGKYAIVSKIPFNQFLGPIKSKTNEN